MHSRLGRKTLSLLLCLTLAAGGVSCTKKNADPPEDAPAGAEARPPRPDADPKPAAEAAAARRADLLHPFCRPLLGLLDKLP